MRFTHVRCLGAAVALGILFASPQVWQRARTLIDLSAYLEPCEPGTDQPAELAHGSIRLHVQAISIPRDAYKVQLAKVSTGRDEPNATACFRCLDIFKVLGMIQGTQHCSTLTYPLRQVSTGATTKYEDSGGFFYRFVGNRMKPVRTRLSTDHLHHRITPRLLASGSVQLDAEFSVLHWSSIEVSATSPKDDASVPKSSVKVSQTIAMGETLVISGLRQRVPRDRIITVPILSRLPVFGDRFIFEREGLFDEEVLFLVTPELAP